MYVARYGDGSEQYSQVLLRFPVVLFEPFDKPQRWLHCLRSAVEHLLTAPDVDFAFRIGLRGRRLERALLLIVPTLREDELSALTAPFLQSNRIADNSVDFCLTRHEYDELLQAFPPCRAGVRNETYRLGEQEVVCDFQIGRSLAEFLSLALQRDWDFAVQINAHRFQPSPDDLRAIRKNLIRLETESGVPKTVLELQRQIVARLATSRFLIDQFLGTGTAVARDSLLQRLTGCFATDYGRLGFNEPPLLTDADATLEAPITTGFHCCLFDETSPMQRAAMAADPAALNAYLTWHPPESWNPEVLANAVLESESDADLLRRIEGRLKRIESSLEAQSMQTDACDQLRKACHILRADPPFALVKARQILEEIIQRVYREQKKTEQVKPLFNMIEELIEAGTVFPRNISSYLHTVRVLGNLVVHSAPGVAPTPLSDQDLELSLLMTLNIVEWYLLQYVPAR
jgi:uncharacterized protein DUF4145